MDEGLDLHAPPDWRAAADRILDGGVRRVMVLGAADVGKSTFCRFILREAQARARSASLLDADLAPPDANVALLDADVGQKTVGPPACVTLAEAGGVRLAFVGAADPVRGWGRVVAGARRLADEAASDVAVVNTSGLLAGPGRRLKAAKIEAVRPDLLIAIGGGPDLERILGDQPAVPALPLTRSPAARRKTDAARRVARREAFRRYFAIASVQAFARALIPETLRRPLQAGVLLGLSDAHASDLGLGVLVGAPGAETLEVLTPVAAGGVRRITPGLLRLCEDFTEARQPKD